MVSSHSLDSNTAESESIGGIQYVAHCSLDGEEAFKAACELGLEGIVSKRLTAYYKSGP